MEWGRVRWVMEAWLRVSQVGEVRNHKTQIDTIKTSLTTSRLCLISLFFLVMQNFCLECQNNFKKKTCV